MPRCECGYRHCDHPEDQCLGEGKARDVGVVLPLFRGWIVWICDSCWEWVQEYLSRVQEE